MSCAQISRAWGARLQLGLDEVSNCEHIARIKLTLGGIEKADANFAHSRRIPTFAQFSHPVMVRNASAGSDDLLACLILNFGVCSHWILLVPVPEAEVKVYHASGIVSLRHAAGTQTVRNPATIAFSCDGVFHIPAELYSTIPWNRCLKGLSYNIILRPQVL